MKYILFLLLPACTPQYITTELSRPESPVLPKVYSHELECINDDAYKRLYEHFRLTQEYALKLETIIDSTKR